MPNIDELDIAIQAEASKAISSLDDIIGKLGKLDEKLGKINGSSITGLSRGIEKLSLSMQGMNNVKTSDFTRLSENIKKLGNANVAGLNKTASSVSILSKSLGNIGIIPQSAQQIGELSKSISRLGYKSVTNAIANIPLLSSALKELMTTLSSAPVVNKDIIDMTNALANLSAQGSKVGSASKGIVGGLNNYSTSAQKATKKSLNLASAIGKFYASYFVVIKGIKGLWGSVEKSMNYLETLNYFDAAFGQVADSADLSQWKTLGYDSAEEYYNSFSKRAKEITSSMTGWNINDNGTLTASGQASLGLDPNQVMQYQAMFGQMSSSMGVSAETSLKLSDALTKIGSDLASVKNMDFDQVWTDMASGLAGMSRTLDKYGVNIRNVNLQQKLTELGIDANIQALNQQDKALLRGIILLDSTQYAWGDLADTIDQPANQLRLLESNWSNLSKTIGDLFLPVVKTVLPYLSGITIALQRLFTWAGALVGLNLGEITDSIGSGGDGIGDLIGDSEELEDSLNGAANSVKKLKTATLGIDELNINSPQEESGSSLGSLGGIGGGILDSAFDTAVSEYQKKWQEAYDSIENRAQEIADNFERMFAPVKNLFENLSVGFFSDAGQDTSNIIVGIFDSLSRAIDDVNWNAIGENIGKYLEGIDWIAVLDSVGDFIWQGIKAGIELWSGAFDAAPIETGIITAVSLLGFTDVGVTVSRKISESIAKNLANYIGIEIVGNPKISTVLKQALTETFPELSWGKILSIPQAIKETGSLKSAFTGLFGDVGAKTLGIGGLIGGFSLGITNFLDMWAEGFSWLNEALMLVGIGLAAVAAVVLGAPAAVAAVVAGIVALVGTGIILIKDNWDSIVSFFDLACEKISGFFSALWDGIKKGALSAVNGIIGFIEGGINKIIDGVNGFIGGIGNIILSLAGITGEKIEISIIPKVTLPRISGYEFGGYPDKASLFWANERGIPELVGTVGGRPAVGSGVEITGIREEIAYMREQMVAMQEQNNALLQIIAEKDPSFSVDGRELVSIIDNRRARNGYALRV